MTPPNETGDDENHAKKDRQASRRLACAAGFAAAAVLVVSFVQGPPDSVPEIALGWPLILYIERAALTAYVIMGLGGLGYRLWRGDQVTDSGAPGGPSVGVEDVTKPAEALKESVSEDLIELSEQVRDVQREVEDLKGGSSQTDA